MANEMKYYRGIIRGKVKKDSNGADVKGTDGNPSIEFVFTSAPPKGFTNTRLQSGGKFVILYLTEDEAVSTKSKSGEEMMIPSPQRQAKEVTVFQNSYPVLFPFLEQAIKDPKYHEKMGDDTLRLTKLLIPGLVDTFDVGFEFYRMTRDPETGKMVPFLIPEKRDPVTGQVVKNQRVRVRELSMYWYGNEVDRVESLRKSAIAALEEYAEKVKPEGIKSNRDAVLESMSETADVLPPTEAAAQPAPVVGG